jgi:hypothetical protein
MSLRVKEFRNHRSLKFQFPSFDVAVQSLYKTDPNFSKSALLVNI